jgi:hypothetical protein
MLSEIFGPYLQLKFQDSGDEECESRQQTSSHNAMKRFHQKVDSKQKQEMQKFVNDFITKMSLNNILTKRLCYRRNRKCHLIIFWQNLDSCSSKSKSNCITDAN